jgi:hypothetical protein
MKRARWLVALLGLFVGVSEVQAGKLLVPYAAEQLWFNGGGFGFSFGRKNRLFVSSSFGFGNVGYYSAYPWVPFGFAPVFYPPINQVTVITVPPPQPVLVQPLFQPGVGDLGGLATALREQLREPPEPPPVIERPMPGVVAGGFRPIGPQDRARAQQPVRPDPPKPPPKPPPEPPKPPPDLPLPPGPLDDPRAEHDRLVALGREAFAAEEYGRAAEFFRRATHRNPVAAEANFLLAQALLPLGKYREAVDAIHAGLRLRPDWPTARFRPLELYGPNVAAFPEHLHRLEAALSRHPDDPVLLFLYAYELWFDGRREEAVPLFERAAPLVPDRSAIERFLQARPGVPIL